MDCPPSNYPERPTWLWAAEQFPNQTILFRCKVTGLQDAEAIRIQITASTRYTLWIAGDYIAQGPGAAVWPESSVDTFNIPSKLMHQGTFTLSCLVHWYGVRTQSHPLGRPGLWFRIQTLKNQTWQDHDTCLENYKIHNQGGWLRDTARRTWATGWMENFDSAQHPHGWTRPDFDDSSWESATIVERDEICLAPRTTPYLKEWSEPVNNLLMAAEVSNNAPICANGSGLTQALDEEQWAVISNERLARLKNSWEQNKALTLQPGEPALALCFDLDTEIAGQPEFNISAEDGVVDYYGAEVLRNGRPMAFKSNAEYANRYYPSLDSDDFRTINYNGFRYLLVVLRPSTSKMTLSRLHIWRRQAALSSPPPYHSTNAELTRLREISIRTLEISTQEVLVDCITREQSLYISDGIWNALWISKIFKEPRYLSHLFRSIQKRQNAEGLFPSAIFTSMEPPQYLIDYCLIYVWGIDLYRQETDDPSLILDLLPSAEKVLHWFQKQTTDDGLIEIDPMLMECHPGGRIEIVFIDHPGVGWHEFSHPGIERSSRMLGLNAFLAIAIQAFNASADAVGYQSKLETHFLDASRLQRAARKYFWDQPNDRFADCIDGQGTLKGWSEQSQALATIAGFMSPDEAKAALTQTLEMRNSGQVCRCTPYTWIYLAQALEIAGMEDRIIPLMLEDWSKMTQDPSTTTCWESFEGVGGDTFCHPWSALPAWILRQKR